MSTRGASLVAQPVAPLHLALDRGDAAGALGMGPGLVLHRGLRPEVERRAHAGTVIRPVTSGAPDPTPLRADVAVVGAGAAGLYAVLAASREGARVALVSRSPLAESASYWAQGGIAAALDDDDSAELHIEDTVRAGRGLGRLSAIGVLCAESPG